MSAPRPHSQLARYKVLIDTARCFGRTRNRQSLIDEILNRSQQVMRAEACTLLLPDARTGELILYSTDPKIAALPEPLRVPPGKGIAGAVFESKTRVNIRDAQKDSRHFQAVGQQVGFVAHAMLTVPLLDGAECVGVLQALNPVDRGAFDEADEEILEGFGGLIASALMRLEAERHEIERAKARQELEVAREIQSSFLPAPRLQFSFGRVHMRYFPAAEVGGDFCCVHQLGNRLLLGLGDVTGKGIPAALTMARVTAMIQATAGQVREDLGSWVTALNQQLVADLQAGRFVGMTFMLADSESSTLQVCAAGQFLPLRATVSSWESLAFRNQLPLGITADVRYKSTTVPLPRGSQWLMVSDGIPEARNRAGEELTLEKFVASLPIGKCAHESLSASISAWKAFSGGAAQHDDASLLLLDWRGNPPEASLETLCCPENLALGRQFIEKWAAYAGCDDVTIGQIVLACDEAATNVFRHGYGAAPGPLRYEATLDDPWLTFKIQDQGTPVKPEELRHRDLADLRPGGLGTYIISKIFDEVEYEPLDQGTRLILRKKVAPA